jgi:hypothetical protein
MQTATAHLARALAGHLTLNMARQRAAAEGAMADHEATSLALAAAAAELDAAAALPFDESADAALLTRPDAFGTPSGLMADARDLDDLHGARRTVDVPTPQGALSIALVAAVRYVESDGAGGYRTALTPTLVKEVAVAAAGPGVSVTLVRLYPYRPRT